jgi:hypothetical protein
VAPLLGVLWNGTWRALSRVTLSAVVVLATGFYVPQEEAASGQPSALMTITVASAYFWALAATWTGALTLSRRVAGS